MKLFSFPGKKASAAYGQLIPIALTFIIFAVLVAALFFVITFLNLLPLHNPISTHIKWGDILVGATIYLKTSADFAILIGLLMAANSGWKNRIAIELGTALGNGLGTILIIIFWTLFRGLHFLLAIMIIFAALVLFELAYQGLDHFKSWEYGWGIKKTLYRFLEKFLIIVTKFTYPVTSRILPNLSKDLKGNHMPWKKLLIFSLTLPFILGLDDFAGYVPLFNLVNIFGFATGVMAAHMVLNIALFSKPEATISFVKNKWIAFLGTVVFIGLAILAIIEAFRILI